MRNIFLSLFLGAGIMAWAQLPNNPSVMMGLTGNYLNDGSNTATQFSSRLGGIWESGFAIGLEINYSQSSLQHLIRLRSLGIGPYLRHYLVLDELSIFLQGRASFISAKLQLFDTQTNQMQTALAEALEYGPGMGFSYFINGYIALETILSFMWQSSNANIQGDAFSESAYTRLDFGISVFF